MDVVGQMTTVISQWSPRCIGTIIDERQFRELQHAADSDRGEAKEQAGVSDDGPIHLPPFWSGEKNLRQLSVEHQQSAVGQRRYERAMEARTFRLKICRRGRWSL